ncbi:alpha-ketoglutarate-dependent dioxygenase AlkB [Shewanella sp. MEBiC00475]|uniref:alpha-ketoglutarate-dependent dioxygenase AlkB family protein n=1 Tax=Shewanella sp. MEBiC00475 TaxID=2575361 RepID=UPI0020C80A05|nr:alpha-ketoglutarate-dependent dioxygenase AlkB [Shewanella sp. MEBiC00475]
MAVFQHGFNFGNIDITSQKPSPTDSQTADDYQVDSLQPPVTLIKQFLSAKQQQLLMKEVASYPLERVEIEVYGKKHLIPRTQAWFGDPGCDYRFSKLQVSPLPWPAALSRLRHKLRVDHHFDSNAVLVNYYANGHDSMGWHSDDEPEIVSGSAIASVTLGAERDFVVRHKHNYTKVNFALGCGDLLIMHAGMQQVWQHGLPKRLKVTEPRVNFTFRKIVAGFYSR